MESDNGCQDDMVILGLSVFLWQQEQLETAKIQFSPVYKKSCHKNKQTQKKSQKTRTKDENKNLRRCCNLIKPSSQLKPK